MVTRVLCLGNDLLADDGFGPAVARELRQREWPLEICEAAESGLYLLDRLQGCERLVVVDVVVTGSVPPGHVWLLQESEVRCAAGGSPHFVGVFEALRTARALGMATPKHVEIVAVEAADVTTIGGAMTSAIAAAVPHAVDLIARLAVPHVSSAIDWVDAADF